MTTIKSVRGWIPDHPDQRDHAFSSYRFWPFRTSKTVDLRSLCSPVVEQGSLGSCTAHALTSAIEFLENKDKIPYTNLSRLFVYYNERDIEGMADFDTGGMLRDGIKALADKGVCSEDKWPYVPYKFNVKPSDSCYLEAQNHKVTSYQRLNTIDDMRTVLDSGFPFVFGFTVYESFETEEVARTGYVWMPGENEKTTGGHSVMACGYDDNKKRFMVKNSWGTDWGNKGYFTMPYDYLSNRNLSDDFWVISRSEGF